MTLVIPGEVIPETPRVHWSSCHVLIIERSLNSDDVLLLYWNEQTKSHFGDGNPGCGLGHAQNNSWVNTVNGIQTSASSSPTLHRSDFTQTIFKNND